MKTSANAHGHRHLNDKLCVGTMCYPIRRDGMSSPQKGTQHSCSGFCETTTRSDSEQEQVLSAAAPLYTESEAKPELLPSVGLSKGEAFNRAARSRKGKGSGRRDAGAFTS